MLQLNVELPESAIIAVGIGIGSEVFKGKTGGLDRPSGKPELLPVPYFQ